METTEENHDNNTEPTVKDLDNCNVDDLNSQSEENQRIDIQCSENLVGSTRTVFNSVENDKIRAGNTTEEPMDLTFPQKNIKYELGNLYEHIQANQNDKHISDSQIVNEVKSNASLAIAKLVQADQLIPSTNAPKKRGRKRKDITIEIQNDGSYNNPTSPNSEIIQMDSRQGEVLIAAKSLFSKRTRTLYHWMYPNTPKAQLKTAVSMSWETLGVQEKEFYISQVLGRFGFPQSSLMVNPQLGGLRGVPILPPLDLSTPAHLNLETHNAVSAILDDQTDSNQAGTSWPQYHYPTAKKICKRRGRIGRPPGSKSQKSKHEHQNHMKTVNVENIGDDFPDDPELRKEFEQFKWALHLNEK